MTTKTQPTITRHDSPRGGSRMYRVKGYDEPMPSVTTVLNMYPKPALWGWYNKMGREAMIEKLKPYLGERLTYEMLERANEEAKKRPEKVRDAAADFGTQAHTLIDLILKGAEVSIPPAFDSVVTNFSAWHTDTGLDIRMGEVMVYSPTLLYAGTFDAMGYTECKTCDPDTPPHGFGCPTCGGSFKRPVIIDFKTSNRLYLDEMSMQLAAYGYAWSEMFGEQITEGWLVRFSKDTPAKPEDAFEVKKVEGQQYQAALEEFKAMLEWYKKHEARK